MKLDDADSIIISAKVTTCVVVWIEIRNLYYREIKNTVTTCVVVWIEIVKSENSSTASESHHLRGGVD